MVARQLIHKKVAGKSQLSREKVAGKSQRSRKKVAAQLQLKKKREKSVFPFEATLPYSTLLFLLKLKPTKQHIINKFGLHALICHVTWIGQNNKHMC